MTRRLTALMLLAVAAASAFANPPELVRYQARLTDEAGVPISGSRDLTFSIHDAPSGGTLLWAEGPRTVTIDNGTADIVMGEVTPLPASVFASDARWLEVAIDGVIVGPRQQVTSVPYAHTADLLDGLNADEIGVRSFATRNTAGGIAALSSNTSGFGNSAFGEDALLNNESGSRQLAVGNRALENVVSGRDNTAVGYEALRNTDSFQNTAVGVQALAATNGCNNTAVGYRALALTSSGCGNTAVGASALENSTGAVNTAFGSLALEVNTIGGNNNAFGGQALWRNVDGNTNCAFGNLSLQENTSGDSNAAYGVGSLKGNTTGSDNVALGANSLRDMTSGDDNTAVGDGALALLMTGNGNTALGAGAGLNVQGSNTIMIGNQGSASDSNLIRIGSMQTATYVAGIRGATTGVADAITVVIDSSGQLGTISSSRRYKHEIRDVDEASAKLLELRPVSFRYTSGHAEGERPVEYGLIAEEVAQTFPELVVLDDAGQPDTVKYRLLSTLLLNELQRQQAEIDELRDALERIELRGSE